MPSGSKMPGLKELGQIDPGHHLHQPAEHVGRESIRPALAGMEQQRQPADTSYCGGERLGPAEAAGDARDPVVGRQHLVTVAFAVGQPGGMSEEVAHRHRPLWLDQPKRAAIPYPLQHLGVRELRQVARHRMVQQNTPLLDQHHHGDAGDRLGHRGDAEQGVGRHRAALLAVRHPEGAQMGDLAAPGDQRRGSGHVAIVDVGTKEIVQPFQPPRAQSHRLGRDDRRGVETRLAHPPGIPLGYRAALNLWWSAACWACSAQRDALSTSPLPSTRGAPPAISVRNSSR